MKAVQEANALSQDTAEQLAALASTCHCQHVDQLDCRLLIAQATVDMHTRALTSFEKSLREIERIARAPPGARHRPAPATPSHRGVYPNAGNVGPLEAAAQR